MFKSEVSRDDGWDAVGQHQFEAVRQVAIDHDWSALRFRNIKYIKNFTHEKRIMVYLFMKGVKYLDL